MPTLKSLLFFDATSCGSFGLLLIFRAALLEHLTAIPATLLFVCGLFLIPAAALMAIVALRFSSKPPAVWLIVYANGAWVIASLVLLTPGLIAPNALGIVFILAQAAFVSVLVFLEAGALRAKGTATAEQ